MKTMMGVLLSAAVLAAAVLGDTAAAQSRAADDAPPEAVSRYIVGTRLGYITCSNKYRDYVVKYDKFALINEGQSTVTGSPPPDDDHRACVPETLVKGRNMYGSAAKQATSTPAKAALKEYQTAWEASLTNLARPGGEKPQEYRTRQGKVQARLDELQRKVEAAAKVAAK